MTNGRELNIVVEDVINDLRVLAATVYTVVDCEMKSLENIE